jgi:hypothetical protein
MDIRRYYRELRELESQIEGKDIFVTSLETPDGGQAGQVAEVAKRPGCKLIVEGRARLSNASEIDGYEKEQAERRAAAEKERLANRLQIHLVTEAPREVSAESKSKQG